MALRRIKKELAAEENPTDETRKSDAVRYKEMNVYHDCVTLSVAEAQDGETEDIFKWKSRITINSNNPHIPDYFPYLNCYYDFEIEFPRDYPFKPPKIKCLTDIYHYSFDTRYQDDDQTIVESIHICFVGGCSCKMEFWSPAYTLRWLMYQILKLIIDTGKHKVADDERKFILYEKNPIQYNLNIIKIDNAGRSKIQQKKLIEYYTKLLKQYHTFDNLVDTFKLDVIQQLTKPEKNLPKDIADVILYFMFGEPPNFDKEIREFLKQEYKLL